MIQFILIIVIFVILMYLLSYIRKVGDYNNKSPNYLYRIVEEKIFSKNGELLDTKFIIKRRTRYIPIWVEINYFSKLKDAATELKRLKKNDLASPFRRSKRKVKSNEIGIEIL